MITHQRFFPISYGPILRAWFSSHPGTKLRLVPVGPGFIVLMPSGHQHDEGRIQPFPQAPSDGVDTHLDNIRIQEYVREYIDAHINSRWAEGKFAHALTRIIPR